LQWGYRATNPVSFRDFGSADAMLFHSLMTAWCLSWRFRSWRARIGAAREGSVRLAQEYEPRRPLTRVPGERPARVADQDRPGSGHRAGRIANPSPPEPTTSSAMSPGASDQFTGTSSADHWCSIALCSQSVYAVPAQAVWRACKSRVLKTSSIGCTQRE
jgi:hypothetical protein